MRPTSRIVQFDMCENSQKYLSLVCLCEDGSIWQFVLDGGTWELIIGVDGEKYV